jgi:hypothetical protein
MAVDDSKFGRFPLRVLVSKFQADHKTVRRIENGALGPLQVRPFAVFRDASAAARIVRGS